MKKYLEMTRDEMDQEYKAVAARFKAFCDTGRKVMMARGNPERAQLDLSMPLLDALNSESDCFSENGTDCRNYGEPAGIIEARRLFGEYMGVSEKEIIITGSQSTTFIYDCLSRAMLKGVLGSPRPWCKEEKIKFICLVPGYDKHFRMCEFFGMEMISVQLTDTGPDMDTLERLVAEDPTIKGMWCVPKFSNPMGCVYSDETVRRLAAMKTAAPDFRIMWDNAYAMHYVYKDVPLLNILDECKKAGNPDRPFMFGSTSKITFPAAGVSFFAASENNIRFTLDQISVGVNSYDKMNMLRHVRFLKDIAHIRQHMDHQAEFMRKKFDIVLSSLDKQLAPKGVGRWLRPNGGYFITYQAEPFCAKRIEELCEQAGVTLTKAGATHPYGVDPDDSYLRLAPSLPSEEDLCYAMDVFCTAAQLATLEKLLAV